MAVAFHVQLLLQHFQVVFDDGSGLKRDCGEFQDIFNGQIRGYCRKYYMIFEYGWGCGFEHAFLIY